MRKKFFSMLVLLAAVATGAWAQTETLLTTITATAKEQASYSTANVATVSFSYTAGGSSAYLANWGWWGYGWSATVTAAEGYTITKCIFYDDANRTATDSEAPFVVETTEEDKTPRINGTPIDGGNNQSKGLKKIEVYGYATPVSGVTLSQDDAVLTVGGETLTLTATVAPANAKDKTVSWTTSNDAVATVDANGVVTAVSAGTATITATATNGTDDTSDDKTATCTVTVTQNYKVTLADGTEDSGNWTISPANPQPGDVVTITYGGTKKVKSVKAVKKAAVIKVTIITLNKTETTINVGSTETLSVTAIDPSNATDKTYTWNSDNTAVATVDADGVVTAKAAGTANITATANDGSGVTATCAVTVIVPVSSITINNAPTEALFVNSKGTLTATVLPDNATEKTVTWSSSDPDYVSINATTGEYEVKGTKGYGSATITASAGGKTATCTITGKVIYTSLSVGTVLHTGDTFYTGSTVQFKVGNSNASFTTTNGVITVVEDNGYYKFKRGSNGTMPNWTAFRVQNNTDGIYITGGSGTSSDRFTLAVHTK
ncbi:MAG: Ig-like domain-containing protein [Prevotella sp.]|nr:Ig-like domain-containing protein [Prevotella sp.]